MSELIQPAYTLRAFEDVPPAPPEDAIFEANKLWRDDLEEHPEAVNAAIGMIMDETTGKAFVLPVVQEARVDAVAEANLDYLSQAGHLGYLKEYGRFILGEELWDRLPQSPSVSKTPKRHFEATGQFVEPPKRPTSTVWAETPGGTGALFLARRALDMIYPPDTEKPNTKQRLLLDPGWGNHQKVFKGYDIQTYQHVDPETQQYNHAEYMRTLEELPEGTPVLMQVCGYNGDGADRTMDQWREINATVTRRKLLPIFDMAYNGLAQGFDKDHAPVRLFVESGAPTMLCASNSKNMSQYGDRLGSYYFFNLDKNIADRLQKNLETDVIRPTWSNPNRTPATMAHLIFRDPERTARFVREVDDVREKVIEHNRRIFADVLGDQFRWIMDRRGLFLPLLPDGFSDAQMAFLRDTHHIHGLQNSRINLGGIPTKRAQEIANIYRQAIFDIS